MDIYGCSDKYPLIFSNECNFIFVYLHFLDLAWKSFRDVFPPPFKGLACSVWGLCNALFCQGWGEALWL